MSILTFQFAAKIPGLHAFSTLRGHNLGLNTDEAPERVVRQRQEVWSSANLPLSSAVFMRQVHGERLQEVGRAELGRGSLDLADAIPDCDALLSKETGVFLCVGHADCLAVLLVDARQKFVGAAHSGWRGAALNVASKLGRAMLEGQGSRPEDLWAGLSVCLGPCHLELSEEQHRIFLKQSGYEDFCSPLKGGHFNLDLWQQAQGQLLGLGLDPGHIEIQRECTACNPERFYSYRREKGNCGRMMSVVGFE